MLKIISITIALTLLGCFLFAFSKQFQAWVLRRRIKRLKADFAKLQGAVLQVEQMKSAVSHWHAKNALPKHEQGRKI